MKNTFLELWNKAKSRDISYFTSQLQQKFDYVHDIDEINNIALYLQICIKKSKPLYLHGFLLTSALAHYLNNTNLESYTLLETGTARGFSAICMCTILEHFNKHATLHTFDLASHTKKQKWNCIAECDGLQSRESILSNWKHLCDNYIKFYSGDSKQMLSTQSFDRIHFAFIDGHHTYDYVKFELDFVEHRQLSGDVIICDDYTIEQYPSICKAIDDFLKKNTYTHTIFYGSDGIKHRGYVYMTKL